MAGRRLCRTVAAALAVMWVCLWGSAEAVGGAKSRPKPQRRPPKKPAVTPIEGTPALNVDMQRMRGTWYLLNTASKCSFLTEYGTQVEPTLMTLTPPANPDRPISVSTKTRHNHQCWEILQEYLFSSTTRRLTLKGSRPAFDTHIMVGETDYTSYAILYYQRLGKITMKLYGRSVDNLSEPVLAKFEELAEKQGLSLAYLIPFPTYSHCGSVDTDHTVNCVPTC